MFENTPLVSIVILTCNRQNLLKNAIDAAFQQNYPNTEIICILGMNSRDMSEEMLTELRAKNMIKFVKNYGNRIDARNKAFEIASGKYVCFLDDDDSMLSNRIDKQVKFLENNDNVDVVSCSTMLNSKVGLMHTFKQMNAVEINNLLMNGVDIDEVVNFQSCMFRKDSIDKAFGDNPKFDKMFIAGGEGQFFIYDCMFNHHLTFANISDTIYIYYVGQAENSLSNVCDPVFYNEHIYGKTFDEKFEFVTNFYKNFPIDEKTEEPKVEEESKSEEESPKNVEENPKKTRKKKADTTTESTTEKPKRGRKKKTEEKPKVEEESPKNVEEKPKKTRKKKSDTTTESTTEKPKRGRKKKTEESK